MKFSVMATQLPSCQLQRNCTDGITILILLPKFMPGENFKTINLKLPDVLVLDREISLRQKTTCPKNFSVKNYMESTNWQRQELTSGKDSIACHFCLRFATLKISHKLPEHTANSQYVKNPYR